MIEVTDSAFDAVRTAMRAAATPVQGVRIAVQAGGCAGLKYLMGLVVAPDPTDIVIERDGIRIFVDVASGPHIAGTKVDFVTGLENSGFTFDNPNAVNKCSCGKSFG